MGFGAYDEDEDQQEINYNKDDKDTDYEIPGKDHQEGETHFEFKGMGIDDMLDKADT